MSHIVSLRGASLRALRSSSSVAAASKYTTNSQRTSQHQQQYSYSTLPLSPNRILISENNKSTKRVRIYLTLLLINHLVSRHSLIKHSILILQIVRFMDSLVVFILVQYFVCYVYLKIEYYYLFLN